MQDNNFNKSSMIDNGENIVFKRSIFPLIYIISFFTMGIIMLIFMQSLFFVGILMIIPGIVMLVFYLKIPRIVARIDGDEIIFYRKKLKPVRAKAEDIAQFTQYHGNKGGATIRIELKDGTILKYYWVSDINSMNKFNRWKTEQMNKKMEELKQQLDDNKSQSEDYLNYDDNSKNL